MAEAPRNEGYLPHAFNPQQSFFDNRETNQARPATSAIITVRIIKNFEYRAMKALVLRDLDLTSTTVPQLIETCRHEVRTGPAFRAYRNCADKLDTVKLYTRAHGAKTTNLIINLDHPEWVFASDGTASLAELGLENETEVSLFHRADYDAFLAQPVTRWDATG
ncbi:hypothetical protein MSPP1_000941 [Malassezia sp. CBS 17886]|nr:hypothetical protein MSPP1_000941 [Malassezia sp. CBS 17886]